jgi:hypothetical protein
MLFINFGLELIFFWMYEFKIGAVQNPHECLDIKNILIYQKNIIITLAIYLISKLNHSDAKVFLL